MVEPCRRGRCRWRRWARRTRAVGCCGRCRRGRNGRGRESSRRNIQCKPPTPETPITPAQDRLTARGHVFVLLCCTAALRGRKTLRRHISGPSPPQRLLAKRLLSGNPKYKSSRIMVPRLRYSWAAGAIADAVSGAESSAAPSLWAVPPYEPEVSIRPLQPALLGHRGRTSTSFSVRSRAPDITRTAWGGRSCTRDECRGRRGCRWSALRNLAAPDEISYKPTAAGSSSPVYLFSCHLCISIDASSLGRPEVMPMSSASGTRRTHESPPLSKMIVPTIAGAAYIPDRA